MASPHDWHIATAQTLAASTARPVDVVAHPKTWQRQGRVALTDVELLADAWCAVVWASAFGTQALLQGIPVIACAPHFFLASACGRCLDDIDAPRRPDNRQQAFERFAWAQWAMSEIECGEAFAHLLQ